MNPISLAGTAFLFAALLVGCSSSESSSETATVQYLTTIPPFEAIVEPVVAGRADVAALLSPGASPHTYEPRPSDVRRVANSTALFYGAPELDAWVGNLSAPASVGLLHLVPPAYRLSLQGLGTEEETLDLGTDPHFWTDPLAVQAMLPALADMLCALDAGGCATYRTNAEGFAARLDTLDRELRTMLAPVQGRAVVLSQPFFRYFVQRYGLEVAFVVEPMPGKEPSPRALQQMVRHAETQNVAVIFTLPQLPPRSAQALAEATGLSVHQLDPIGGVEGRQRYVELLRYNAGIVLEALR